jgi:hypothetical protein
MIVQPETLLRWHRDFFRFVWRHKSKAEAKPGRPPLSDADIARIKGMSLALALVTAVWRDGWNFRPGQVSSRRARCLTGCITQPRGWQHKALGTVKPNALSITDSRSLTNRNPASSSPPTGLIRRAEYAQIDIEIGLRLSRTGCLHQSTGRFLHHKQPTTLAFALIDSRPAGRMEFSARTPA